MASLPVNLAITAEPDVRPPDSHQASRKMLVIVSCYFLIAGIATVMLGPILPELAMAWKIPDSRLGTLFMAMFAGEFAGSWFATPRLHTSMVLGAAIAAFGMVLLAIANPTTALFALFCIGTGIGASLTAGNVTIGTCSLDTGEENSGRKRTTRSTRARNLAMLNFSWGVGAISCPLLLAASMQSRVFHVHPGRLFLLSLAFALVGSSALIAFVLPSSAVSADEGSQASSERAAVPWRLFSVFAVTLLLYVGVENTLSGWLPLYDDRLFANGLTSRAFVAIAVCFWASELASRGITTVILPYVEGRKFYRMCLLVLVTATAALTLSSHLSNGILFALTSIAALSIAPLYPLAVSFLLAQTGSHPRVGKIFAFACIGGTILPWMTGVLSSHAQSLRIGLVVPVLGAALMLLLSFWLPVTSSNQP